MRPVPSPALLRAFLLLPLAACGWVSAITFPNFASSDDPVHIYTSSDWRNFHLQIHPDGRVDGTQPQTVYSALLIKPVNSANVVFIGANTGLNLCMHSDRSLFGSPSFSKEDCVFKHTLLENRYDVYESVTHHFLVSLGRVKGALHSNRDIPPFSQFLQRRNEIPLSKIYPLRYPPEDINYGHSIFCLDLSTGEMREGSPGDEDCVSLS